MKRALFLLITVILLSTLLYSCGDKVTDTTVPVTTAASTTAPATTTATATTTPATSAAVDTRIQNEYEIAVTVASFLNDIELVQQYYNDGMTAMVSFRPFDTSVVANLGDRLVALASAGGKTNDSATLYVVTASNNNIPPEFMDELPPSGAMPAGPGSCAAAAKPEVTFETASGDKVTPELFEEIGLETIPSELLTVAKDDPASLYSIIENMVPIGDRSLATEEGWDNLLWDPLKALQEPAASLLDYHLWAVQKDIILEISDMYYQRLVEYGVPQNVLDAYNESKNQNWYSSVDSHEEDALARMDIVAEMTGSVSGTVYEQRDFTCSGLNQAPVYGVQTGYGTVTCEHPSFGDMDFDVDINLDQFDDMGKAVGGTVVGANEGIGYTVEFTYKPDGTKEGQVIGPDGEVVGYLTMTVDHERFENYVDVKEGTTMQMPVFGAIED